MADKGKKGRAPTRYPDELKERVVKMVQTLRQEDPADHGVVTRVSRQLGVGTESLCRWVKQAEVDSGARGGLTTEDQQELAKLLKENFELRRANDILQAAATFFGAELYRRHKR
jgi:transposase